MFSRFSEEAQKALILAKAEMNNLRHPYVGSEHLLLSILSMKDLEITKTLASYNITYEVFKKELIKIVRTTEGNVIIDESGKANGRGAYLKKDLEVITKARKSKILNRVLEIEVPDALFDELVDMLK